MAVGRDEEFAERLLETKFEAPNARKRVIDLVRGAGFEHEATELDASWKDTATGELQETSHVGHRQLQALLDKSKVPPSASVGGRRDSRAVTDSGGFVIAAEMRFLAYLLGNYRQVFSRNLVESVENCGTSTLTWLKSTGDHP